MIFFVGVTPHSGAKVKFRNSFMYGERAFLCYKDRLRGAGVQLVLPDCLTTGFLST